MDLNTRVEILTKRSIREKLRGYFNILSTRNLSKTFTLPFSLTDLADYLVQKCNIPFREAHFITGRAVAHAESLGLDLSKLSVEELQKVDARIGEDVVESLSLVNSMNARTSQGGTATSSTYKQIELFEAWINERKKA